MNYVQKDFSTKKKLESALLFALKKQFTQTAFLFVFAFEFAFVLTVCGCTKKTVGQKDVPQRIISLSPAGTEILFSIGAENQIIAVSEFSDYPPEALEKTVIGGFDGKSISLEKILSLSPDFIYLTDGMHNFMIGPLEAYGIKFYLSNASSIEAIKNEILELGELTGHKDNAERLVKQMSKSQNEARARVLNKNGRSPRVYYEVWASPFMTAGASSFINDIITSAGGSNIFSDLSENYPLISEETIIARNPEFILIPQTSGLTKEQVAARIGWGELDAVKNGRIILIDDNVYTRSGPRITDCIKELSEIFGSYAG